MPNNTKNPPFTKIPLSKRPRAKSLPAGALVHRIRIAYSDDALCENAIANMERLVRAAQEDDSICSTSATLARKALQYRKKLEDAQAVDVNDPAFDIATFMGVTWCKVSREM